MADRPTLDDIHSAKERLRGVAVRTPLVPLHAFDGLSDIFLKLENLQPIGSFKLRGIFNAVAALTPEQRAAGISTTSSGNTAQALAWSGRYFGVTSRSLMPENAPESKIEAMRAYGGTPVLVTREHLFDYMANHGWDEEPYAFIHPWIDPVVMAGAGTIGLEIVEDLPDVETIFVPVGGGGLSSGVGTAIKSTRPDIRIVAVEPEGCCALSQSLEAGKPVSVSCNTICDGVAVPLVVPEVFEILREVIDDVVLVSDDDVKKTIKRLALRNKVVTESAGALATTAAILTPVTSRGKSAAIVTGGSVEPDFLAAILTDQSID